jgi:hypothetical protein
MKYGGNKSIKENSLRPWVLIPEDNRHSTVTRKIPLFSIEPGLLKELSSEIAPLLQLVYQKSLDTSCVPEDWRKANVTPIYKKGPKYLAENYRPVSLTSVCCKIMEHVLASNIMRHGEDNGILYQLQHGFRRNRSCETQLIEFMDFAKAFDKVNHSLLVHKIHQYGIRGKVNSWIKSWLSGRNQTVVVEGVNSSQVDAETGIPQGSVLEPSLFIFYINDLQDRLRSTVRLFADDTIAYLTITSEDDAEHLQEDLDKLAQWGEDWFMQFHPAKCTVLTVTNKRNPIVTEYTIRGQLLSAVTSARYLGDTITDKVNWSIVNWNIDSITNKANRTLGFLRRNLKISSISIKEQAYKTLVRPLVEYASPVWDPHHQTDIRKLECVQRRAARFVLSSQHNRSSVTDMIQRLG